MFGDNFDPNALAAIADPGAWQYGAADVTSPQYDFSGYGQARPIATPADVSWTGLTDLPAVARAAVSVAQTGFGLSLAKDQILAQRDIGKASLQATIARAQSDALIARYQGAAQVGAAQRAAIYPNGVPFGTTRQDQLMIAIGIAGLFLAYLQIHK